MGILGIGYRYWIWVFWSIVQVQVQEVGVVAKYHRFNFNIRCCLLFAAFDLFLNISHVSVWFDSFCELYKWYIHIFLEFLYFIATYGACVPSSPPIDDIWAMMVVSICLSLWAALKYDGTADGTAGALLAIIRRLAMQLLLFYSGKHRLIDCALHRAKSC